jgi:hypothetical protein
MSWLAIGGLVIAGFAAAGILALLIEWQTPPDRDDN